MPVDLTAEELVPLGRHPFGHDRRERPHDGVGVVGAEVVAVGGGGGVGGVQDGAHGDDDLDGADQAGVVGDVGVDHLQHREDASPRRLDVYVPFTNPGDCRSVPV